MPQQTFTALVEYDAETGMYVGSIPQLPGAFTQGATLDELRTNLTEVIELVLEEMAANGEQLEFGQVIGTQQVTVDL